MLCLLVDVVDTCGCNCLYNSTLLINSKCSHGTVYLGSIQFDASPGSLI